MRPQIFFRVFLADMNPALLNSLNVGAVFRDSDFPAVGLSFSRNGESLGVGFEDGTVQVINTETAEVVRTHRSHKYGLSHFSFLNQDRRGSLAVAVASPTIIEDNSVRIWDLVSNRFFRVLKCHDSQVANISVHASRDILLSTSKDGLTCMWDMRDDKPIWQCREEKCSTAAFDRSEGSDIFAVTSPGSNSVGIYDYRKFQSPMKEIKCGSSLMSEIAFTHDRERLLVAYGEAGNIASVILATGSVESTYYIPPTKRGYFLSSSFCSRFAMASNPNSNSVDIWDIRTRVKIRSLAGHESPSIGAFSPKHAMVATSSLPVALWVPLTMKR